MSGPIISAGWVGRVIDGRFALHEWLGGSEASGVFRTDLPQPVVKKAAIKLIPAEGAVADAYVAGWAKATNLSHPHLIRVFRSGRFQFGSIGLAYVVTECADEVLSQILPARALTTDETREMLEPVIDALGYLHEKGFVHGHLKPANILVVEDQLKISIDGIGAAGLRNPFDPSSAYDAPEVGSGALSAAADVWSLGMTLVETLTQRTPRWNRGSRQEPALPEGMPRAFAEIARDCLRLDPDARCSLKEIKDRLEPNKPIEFPAAKREKAPAAVAVNAPVESAVEPNEESGSAQKKMPFVPLVLGLIAVVAIIAVLMLRGHGKKDVGAGVGSESAPTASSAGTPAQAVRASTPSSSSPVSGPVTKRATAKGEVLERKMPEVTPQARRTIHGTVTVAVLVTVDTDGRVSKASFKSEGPSKYFAKAALEAARGWTFKPAEKNGAAVASTWVVRFKFRQRGDDATAVEETR